MYFTTGQAAKLLGVSRETVKAWVKSGKVPYIQWGNRRLVDLDGIKLMKRIVEGKRQAESIAN